MKSVYAFVVGLFLIASVGATSFEASTFIESDFVYRGVNYTDGTDAPSIGAKASLSDLFGTGLYVRGAAQTTDFGSYEDTVWGDFGVGYLAKFDPVSVDVSFNRVFNPVVYAKDFNEARLQVSADLTDSVAVFGRYALQVGSTTASDSYSAIGTEWSNAFGVSGLSFDGLVAFHKLNGVNGTDFNNIEVGSTYALTKSIDVYARYSNGRIADGILDDHLLAGARYSF